MAYLLIQKMLLLGSAFVVAATPDETVDYQKQVRHVLQDRCFACHGALKQEGGLRVDTAVAAIQGGESGAAIVPGRIDESLLLQRISATDLSVRMPPEGEPLKPDEIANIRRWIEQGAATPANEVPESDPQDHWAFKRPVRPAVPQVSNSGWVLNPIDAFIAQSHEAHGLTPQPAADRRVWLRRVSLDLTGLPPSRAEQEAFLADDTPDAWDRVVTRLLDSPQYGERWGRHWMDIWRYSDWWGLGAEVRNSQKHIWHWRDWIIESMNADTAYDQMLREMLAADELYPNDLQKLRASGFLARQYFKFNRTSWLDETVEHTSKSMLGLTINCCKCHDHKYDPISQVEYYQMRAFFEPYQVRTDAVPGELDFEKDGIPRAFDCNLHAKTFVHRRGDDRNPDESRIIEPVVPVFLASETFSIQPVSLPIEAQQPGLRPFVVEAHLKAAEHAISAAQTALTDAQDKLAESEKAAQTTVATSESAEDAAKPSTSPEVLVSDDFSAPRPDLWEQRSGQWAWVNGRLVQSQSGAMRAALRLRQLPPADFQVTLKYKPTGGDEWKSIGITFDGADDNSDVTAYLSSYSDGPKAQLSYQTNGAQEYPGTGAEARPVDLNEAHELTVRVRGSLINLVVDGKQSVAYRLPVNRRPGHLELMAFDAIAEFTEFTLSTLPMTQPMVDAADAKSSDGRLPMEQSRLMVVVAERNLRTAQLQPASISARAAAERARLEQPDAEETRQLQASAVRAERIVTSAKAEADAATAELEWLQAAPEKKAEAEARVTATKVVLEASRQAIETPGDQFTSLMGSLKTFENNLETEDSRRRPFPSTSTGRRSALAAWITDPRHPLPARVAVNHLWARHFGGGIVPTVFDFGRKGTAPTHPELLDWLATEFVEQGWSMKHIHCMIVLSNTYRMSSSSRMAADGNVKTDRDNRYYWRRNPVRMEAQIVRDSLLSLAGRLDLTMGGPSIPVDNAESQRRSLYYVHSHNEHQTFLSIFDDASVLECYRRAESIVPQQALAMENSPLAREVATAIATAIEASPETNRDEFFIREAFLTVLNVEPAADELAASQEALSELSALAAAAGQASPTEQARQNFVQALLNHNDFVTIR